MKKNIPHYSQYLDVKLSGWQKYACGIVSLRMITDYYKPKNKRIPIDKTIKQGLVLHAYISGIGWAYKGLIRTAHIYGCDGFFFDWKDRESKDAYRHLTHYVNSGPVMVSIPKDFKEKNSSHLVILEKIENNTLFLIDPATRDRKKIAYTISLKKFLRYWKQRALIIRPAVAPKKK